MDTRTVLILEGSTNRPVEADLHLRMTAEQVLLAENRWHAHRQVIGADTEHAHWDWSRKVPELGVPGTRCLGIECAGMVQGMMIVRELNRIARLDPDRGERVLYVDFLEAAPWNVRRLNPNPTYLNVGLELVRVSVEESRRLGFAGRIGLDSLPQSEGFYERACGMVAWGQDPEYNGLMYLELTTGLADRLSAGGEV